MSIPVDVSQNPLNILGITIDQYENVWIATKYHGVLKRDAGNTQWKAYDNTTDTAIFLSNRVNDIATDTTSQDSMRIGLASDASGFIILSESTKAYLPQLPAAAHIVGQDTLQPLQIFTYHLSAAVPQATEYIWSYTGNDVSLTPNDTAVQLLFGSNATSGTLRCKIRNNYTKPINDTLVLTFDILDNTVGIAENSFANKCMVYPNPVTDKLCIYSSDDLKSSDEYTCYIYSSTFKLMKTGKEKCIVVSDLSAGMYFLMLTNKEGKRSFVKFIKE
ncbi:MAG: T9SS type A sorting domain-containing protein [Bacteroidales bacterium]